MALEQLLNAYIPRGKNIKYNDEFTDKAVVIRNGHRTTNDRTSEKTVPKLIFSQHDRIMSTLPFMKFQRRYMPYRATKASKRLNLT